MRKRLLSLTLALVMALTLLPTAALAADSDFDIRNGSLVNYTGPGGEVVIPFGVKEINLYFENTNITSVIIPDSVTSIGQRAFRNCSNLTSVSIPNSVTAIEPLTFQGCSSLTGVTIPNSVTTIYDSAFSGCTSLASVTIPDSVTKIDNAFNGCTSLTSVVIGSGAVRIDPNAFRGCSSLSSIAVAPDNPVYASFDGALFDKAMGKLLNCPDGKQGVYTIPDGVTTIDSHAFMGCNSLTGIVLGKNVKSIAFDAYASIRYGTYAFHDCISLTSFEVSPENPYFTVLDGVLFTKNANTLISCPQSGKTGMYTVPDGVTKIEPYAFQGCIHLTGVTIPKDTDVGENAFDGCTDLTVYGYSGSKAENYCLIYGIPFQSLDAAPSAPDARSSPAPSAAPLPSRTLTEIIPCKYDYVSSFSDGLAFVRDFSNHQEGFIDTTGRMVISCDPSASYRSFSDGLASVYVRRDAVVKGITGYIDKTGKKVISPQYHYGDDFSEGLAAVGMETDEWLEGSNFPLRKDGYIDHTGREVIPLQYNAAKAFSNGLAPVGMSTGKVDGNGDPIYAWGVIDKTGREIIPCKYDEVEILSENLIKVGLWNGTEVHTMSGSTRRFGYGVCDVTGQEILPCQYTNVFLHGPYIEAGVGMIFDMTGQKVSSLNHLKDFHEGLAYAVDNEEKQGYIDEAGNMVISGEQYLGCGDFHEGLAAVTKEPDRRSWAYIDQTGKEVLSLPSYFNAAGDFSDGLAYVHVLNEGYGYIDKTGQLIVPLKYDSVRDFSEGFAAVQKEGKWGFIDTTGREVVPCQYSLIEMTGFSDGRMWVQRDGKYGFLGITENAPTAYASTQSVLVDGSPVEFQAYALKDANGNDTNYIKLRDVASVLNGTAVQFNVGWDGAVNIETGKGYTPNGSEMNTPFYGDRAYENATAETRINGSRAALDAIVLKDDNGGAYTYYKLRDLGAALDFRVDWSAEKGIFIETK